MSRKGRIRTGTLLLCLCLTACAKPGADAGVQTSLPAQTEGTLPVTNEAPGYYFLCGETVLYPDMDVTSFPALSVTQTGYFEAESCAALGLDRTYLFSDFEIMTWPDGDHDLIRYILIKTDAVRTPEGADLSMDRARILAIYGEGKQDGSALVYEKGGMRLMFFFDEQDLLTSIEYRSGTQE